MEHAWITKKSAPDSYWVDRQCSVCLLEDTRKRDPATSPWKVTTPCIVPVASRITYEELMKELNAHKVNECVACVGIPGEWETGLRIGGPTYIYRIGGSTRTPEEGFANVLRWMRARQFDVHRYSDLAYAKLLASPDRSWVDDD
jgi:hypothetical protein